MKTTTRRIVMITAAASLSCIMAGGAFAAESACLTRLTSNKCQIVPGLYSKVCDCSNATNLAGLVFTSGYNFDGVNFSGANLKGCNFTGVSVSGANFSKADLKNVTIGTMPKSSLTNFTCARWTDGRVCNSKSSAGTCVFQTASDKPQCNNSFTN